MGYYTRFELDYKPKSPEKAELVERALEESDLHYNFDESRKWYDHEKDMADFSKKFPQTVFTLNCTGEDGEKWRVYAFNGVSQKCTQLWYGPTHLLTCLRIN